MRTPGHDQVRLRPELDVDWLQHRKLLQLLVSRRVVEHLINKHQLCGRARVTHAVAVFLSVPCCVNFDSCCFENDNSDLSLVTRLYLDAFEYENIVFFLPLSPSDI